MNLIQLSPDPDRAERIKALCHKRMARQHQTRLRGALDFDRALIGGFCAIYLASLALNAINIFGTR